MPGPLPVPDFRADPEDRADLRPRSRKRLVASLVLLAMAAATGWWWWQQAPRPEAPPPVAATSPRQEAPAPASEPHPVPAPAANEAIAPEGIAAALQELLGRSTLEAFVLTEDFPRRLVATIDQLGREHAPASVWPVVPAPGRFSVEQRDGGTVIAADNAARYTPMVNAFTAVDPAAAAAVYRRMYPLLDRAWRTLGMGDRVLNERVIEVIDLLLRTPEPTQPLAVRLTEVKGPIASTRPWVRYEFADPQLEALPAGQKILLRLGQPQRKRVQDALRAFRRNLVQVPAPARPSN